MSEDRYPFFTKKYAPADFYKFFKADGEDGAARMLTSSANGLL